jgi:hypothetical protein
MKLKMRYGGNIYYHNECAYLDAIELTVKKKHDLFYNIKNWLIEEGYDVDYDNCLFLNNGETSWISYLNGMSVAVSTGYKDQVYIVAQIDITFAKTFEWFDDVIKFERFYQKLKEYVIEHVKIIEELDE